MKFLISVLILGSLALGQGRIGLNPNSVTATLTVVVTGTGTGSVSSADGKINNCTSAGGANCVGTYNLGSNSTLTPTATGGSTFAWGSGPCSGITVCTITGINSNTTATGIFTIAGGNSVQAVPFFALNLNSSTQFPTGIAFGQGRAWDTPNITRTFIETCTNGTNTCTNSAGQTTINFTNVDSWLALLHTNGVNNVQYAAARTPYFASSDKTLTVQSTVNGFSGTFTSGETIIQTGSGVTSTFVSISGGTTKTMTITDYAGTANSSGNWVGQTSGATLTPAALPVGCNYFLNGGTAPNQLSGQCAAPTDLAADGTGTNLYWRNFIAAFLKHVLDSTYLLTHAKVSTVETWNEPSVTKFSRLSLDQLIRLQEDLYCILKGGVFTIRATGETCTQVRATVTSVSLSSAIDPTTTVLMPSYFGQGIGLTQMQNFLYCTGSPATSCHVGGHATTDGINFHGKPGSILELQMDIWLSAIQAILVAPETTKPIFNTEGGYAAADWTSPYTDPNMQAGYLSRFFIYSAFKGIFNNVWYQWKSSNGLGSSNAGVGMNQTYGWLVGDSIPVCVLSADGSHSPNSLWTCTVTLPNGISGQFMWNIDPAFYCASSVCPTQNQTVPNPMLHYLNLEDPLQTPNVISSHLVPVGNRPVFVQAQ